MTQESIAAQMGRHIRLLRQNRGLSMEKLAELSTLSVGFISELERGRKVPSLETLVKLASTFQLALRELIAPLENGHSPRITKFELMLRLQSALRDTYHVSEAEALVEMVRNHPQPN